LVVTRNVDIGRKDPKHEPDTARIERSFIARPPRPLLHDNVPAAVEAALLRSTIIRSVRYLLAQRPFAGSQAYRGTLRELQGSHDRRDGETVRRSCVN